MNPAAPVTQTFAIPLSPPRPGTDHGLVEAGLKSVNATPHPAFPSAVASFVQSQAFVSIWC